MGLVLMGLGALIWFLDLGGLLEFLKLRKLKRRGVQGEAVSTLHDWIEGRQRVYYDVLLPGASPQSRPPRFVEIGVEPRGPVGTVVPVVYDRRRASRARTGTLADIADMDMSGEGDRVVIFWVPGLACVVVGAVLLGLGVLFY
ncbi:hypothetical protein ABZZ79_25000 [Streptomyces sp. NPDC006458]|uniref:hypothetical protein n=1 Tax=Streptomyces sp. NPDC006458 TaxID=3154302 RepID=UPI0033AC44C8